MKKIMAAMSGAVIGLLLAGCATAGNVASAGLPAREPVPVKITWPMFEEKTITYDPVCTPAKVFMPKMVKLNKLNGNKVKNGGARFVIAGGVWAGGIETRIEDVYLEYQIPVRKGTFTVNKISVKLGSAGTGGMHWDVQYAKKSDFSDGVLIVEGQGCDEKDVIQVVSSADNLGISLIKGETLFVRVYPYMVSKSESSGKSIMVANMTIEGIKQ
jgi:hypothetical protein